MDNYCKYMDYFFMHLAPIPRAYPNGLPVQSIGYAPLKRDTVSRAFDTCNFSLILTGEGFYQSKEGSFPVKAPCVLTQWPGEPVHYGPGGKKGYWEELYFIYDSSAAPVFRHRNLYRDGLPMWSIDQDVHVVELVHQLRDLLLHPRGTRMVDRIDRTCELLIVESRMAENRPPLATEEQAIRAIRHHVREQRFITHDFDALASKHGLSPTTFRRHWNRYVHEPPARYVLGLRIREARRLLAETDLPVADVARQTGFEDPFYFSRCFRRMTGISPRPYRNRFRAETEG